jgi:hypothetical protein
MSEERQNDEKRKAVEQLQKILELARNNPSEHEAALAMAMFQERLARYNLTMADIVGNTSVFDNIIRDNDFVTYFSGWIKPLLNAVAKLNFCGYYYTSIDRPGGDKRGFDQHARKLYVGTNSRTYLIHNFIGEEVNVLGAKLFGEYLIETMEILVKQARKGVPVSEQSSFKISFMNACSYRLCARIAEEMETKSVKEVGGLPALQSMYDKARQNAESFLDGLKVKRTTKTSLVQFNNTKGYREGYAAADSIGLKKQVDGTTPNKLRISH